MPWPPPNTTNVVGTMNITTSLSVPTIVASTSIVVGTKGANVYGTAAFVPGGTNTDANFSNALAAIANINKLLVSVGLTV